MAKEERQTKPCRMCCEEIDIRARACPQCGQLQRSVQLWIFIPMALLIAATFVGAEMMSRRFRVAMHDPEALPYSGQIRVTESRMLKGTSADGDTVFVVGRLRNESDVEWEQIEMEVEFLDPEGQLIDVEVERHYLAHILPRGEMAFKLRTVADRPVEQYADYKVFVRWADDARRSPF